MNKRLFERNPVVIEKLNALWLRIKRAAYDELVQLPVRMQETSEHLRHPDRLDPKCWRPASPGDTWGKAWGSCWFQASVTVDKAYLRHPLHIIAEVGGSESCLYVNGETYGMLDHFGSALTNNSSDNMNIQGYSVVRFHASRLIQPQPQTGESLEIHLEAYAGHPLAGLHPFDGEGDKNWRKPAKFHHRFASLGLAGRRENFHQLALELRALLSLHSALSEDDFFTGRLRAFLLDLLPVLPFDIEAIGKEAYSRHVDDALEKIRAFNASQTPAGYRPFFATIGHSHMDTAWLWPLQETIRKCARTYANALKQMERYPRYAFLQSSALHAEWMRDYYPDVFEGILRRVREGRWEANGGTYVEPDVNLPSGEALIRNFLIGNQVNRELFGTASNVFWLPDCFGFSAAIPQIMKGFGIEAFFTSKLYWNDTNRFPHDTFWWRGIDGTAVVAHLHIIHCWPDPATLFSEWKRVRNKDVEDRRMLPFGFGDGGGGPNDEMIEMADITAGIAACPELRVQRVGTFADGLRKDLGDRLPAYDGELYVEGHRGTLTTIHGIKRGNRRAEIALRETEFLLAMTAGLGGDYPREALSAIWKKLLVNQFHDILPGTSLPEVHDRAIRELEEVREAADALREDAVETVAAHDRSRLTLVNSLSWHREGIQWLDGLPTGIALALPEEACQQGYEDISGIHRLAVRASGLPALSAVPFSYGESSSPARTSAFRYKDGYLETPLALVRFNGNGEIESYRDKASGREFVSADGPWNRFVMSEDVPSLWDNWNIDYDYQLKDATIGALISSEVLADGPLFFALRQEVDLGFGSRLTQDLVFKAESHEVSMRTRLDWKARHRCLKVAFPCAIHAHEARHEIQFGHLARPTHENFATDWSRFECCNHKWTDLAETEAGVTLMNDCKYGISVDGGDMRLTLMKSGGRPDPRGDEGVHLMNYAVRARVGGFSARSVVRPAYEFNYPIHIYRDRAFSFESELRELPPNVIVETVKLSEADDNRVYRLYECANTRVNVELGDPAFEACDMEENPKSTVPSGSAVEFHPFEIKTLKALARP